MSNNTNPRPEHCSHCGGDMKMSTWVPLGGGVRAYECPECEEETFVDAPKRKAFSGSIDGWGERGGWNAEVAGGKTTAVRYDKA